MALKTRVFDSSKYLGSREAQVELFSDALQSGDAGYIAAALGTIARACGMTQIAEESGLSRPALYAALREGGNPTLDTVMRVAAALGVELRAVPAGTDASKGGEALQDKPKKARKRTLEIAG
jgi:probable addiction module antidote protein